MSGYHAPEEDPGERPDAIPLWRNRKIQLLVLGGFLVLAFIFTRGQPSIKKDARKEVDQTIGVVSAYKPIQAEPQPTPPVKLPDPPKVAFAPPAPAPPPAPPSPPPMPSMRQTVPLPPGVMPKATPLMASYAVHVEPRKAAAPAPGEPAQTGLDFKTATLPGLKASPAIDDTYQLMPGLLPCVLDTAIQSDLPGPILCHLPGPVYSPKGVLLMEAGTSVIGKYETMGKTGSNRLFAVSTYAHTPNGIWVPLAGEPMADDLGRSGLDGAVDHHFARKFGTAILLTMTQSALGIIQAAASSGGNTYLQLNSGGGGSGIGGVAQQMLQQQATINDTFSKDQGETIAIFLDQPIDFSSSYKIRTAK